MIKFTAKKAISEYLCKMDAVIPIKKDFYYTADHEWINFQGSVAYVGVYSYKLTACNKINEILFEETSGFKKQGDLIALLRFDGGEIRINMPVDGKIVNISNALLTDDFNILLSSTGAYSWIAQISPSQPYERGNLMSASRYLSTLNRKL
ncbi:glycine cleavage system H protein [Chitinophaga terrae (ex Kim and Jung 2007)]|uniref:Glycine cleavage system H protein n=2 Tax=Chitinophaga terrae (ex Kim and Jung 2007) TaxID=408074 RepID=A0A1H4BM90_9BACT|nr:glycine cleavage system H protein [Chitinophaga terrae (ex Kim and Jung 2007)]